jgi:hypothetical protein
MEPCSEIAHRRCSRITALRGPTPLLPVPITTLRSRRLRRRELGQRDAADQFLRPRRQDRAAVVPEPQGRQSVRHFQQGARFASVCRCIFGRIASIQADRGIPGDLSEVLSRDFWKAETVASQTRLRSNSRACLSTALGCSRTEVPGSRLPTQNRTRHWKSSAPRHWYSRRCIDSRRTDLIYSTFVFTRGARGAQT